MSQPSSNLIMDSNLWASLLNSQLPILRSNSLKEGTPLEISWLDTTNLKPSKCKTTKCLWDSLFQQCNWLLNNNRWHRCNKCKWKCRIWLWTTPTLKPMQCKFNKCKCRCSRWCLPWTIWWGLHKAPCLNSSNLNLTLVKTHLLLNNSSLQL